MRFSKPLVNLLYSSILLAKLFEPTYIKLESFLFINL